MSLPPDAKAYSRSEADGTIVANASFRGVEPPAPRRPADVPPGSVAMLFLDAAAPYRTCPGHA